MQQIKKKIWKYSKNNTLEENIWNTQCIILIIIFFIKTENRYH